MKFFMPGITDPEEAEFFYQELAENRRITPEESQCRVRKLRWVHNGMKMLAEIGKPLASLTIATYADRVSRAFLLCLNR
jgi:hypothetical protein